MRMLTVVNGNGEAVGEVRVSDRLEGAAADRQLVRDVIVGYMRNRRRGTASTLTKGEVRASGRKPYRQKGTGRARVGTIASPIRRGGGAAFGPRPRGYARPIPKDLRRRALVAALAAKLREGDLVVVDTTDRVGSKTREIARWLARIGAGARPLIVVSGEDQGVIRASRNIPGAAVVRRGSLNALVLMAHGKVVMARGDLESLQERLA
ncbi:MAG: 50S ribosomal protein L4 [bacterium]|nr:50S ribosomal protein L4 [bacterium]